MVSLNQNILNQSINITNWGANSPALSPGLNPLLSPLSLATTSSDFQPSRTFLTENAGPALNARRSGNVSTLPSLYRNSQSLGIDKEANEITTAGGYKIKATGKDEGLTITTPEGKKVDIWGDPHVKTSDGTEFQFKDDSTIQLKDGTVIALDAEKAGKKDNAPTYLNNVAVFSPNGEHATISGIGNNQPQTSDATRTPAGFSLGPSFKTDDAYVLTADEGGLAQLTTGRKVTGSENNGAIQEFGGVVATANPNYALNSSSGRTQGNPTQSALSLLNALSSFLGAASDSLGRLQSAGSNFGVPSCIPGFSNSSSAASDLLGQALRLVGDMLSLAGSMIDANNSPLSSRNQQVFV